MSTESVRQFLSAASSDSALKQKLAAATDSVNFVKIAKDSGYNFTLEDLQAHIAQHNNGELSEDELETVAGGNVSYIESLSNLNECWAVGGNWPPINLPGGGGGRPPRGRPTRP